MGDVEEGKSYGKYRSRWSHLLECKVLQRFQYSMGSQSTRRLLLNQSSHIQISGAAMNINSIRGDIKVDRCCILFLALLGCDTIPLIITTTNSPVKGESHHHSLGILKSVHPPPLSCSPEV